MKSVCILGRQPAIGMAELESLYGADKLRAIEGAAVLNVEAADINFKRLGGTIKVARVLAILPTVKWPALFDYLYDSLPAHIEHLPDGKFTLGISTYGLDVPLPTLNRNLREIKKLIKASHPVRIVPNKTNALSSAQVLHNKLTHKGAWELIFITDGDQTILGQTMFVQDIEGYAARDQARPKRDSRVGMLPPKLAQTIINLAQPPPGATILDPFCGTGVILQEALLMGYNGVGSDIEPKMIDYSQTNMKWLRQNSQRELGETQFEVADATDHQWQSKFDSLASEIYLGRPFTSRPQPEILRQTIQDVNLILKKFLVNLGGQVPGGFRLSLAVPAWRNQGGGFHRLPILERLTEMGYNRIAFEHAANDELIYARDGQHVGRELLVLEKL